MFSEENSLTSALHLFGLKRQSLRCLWKVQEEVGGGRDLILFADNHEFSLFHLAFIFIKTSCLLRLMLSIEAPESSTCGY